MSAVRTVAEVDPASAQAVRALAEAATALDGREPLSEQFLINLNGRARPRVVHLLAEADGAVVGYAQLDRTSAELVVHPDHRRRGVGAALLAGLLERAPELDVWAHGDLPAAAALAAAHGLTRNRVLWQMRRTPEAGSLPALSVPEGVTLRPFVVGQDEAEFLRVNNAAFAWHPEQGGWSEDQVTAREAEEWFDPAGFLLAVDEQGTLLGYHWTKVHPATPTDPSMGEVYVLGVDPAAHGKGLGRVLTLAGLHHLAERGLDTVLLYVESDNAPAVRVYEKLGFGVHTADVMYHRG
ncbi:mycothiol synthase [Pseudonocardia pini]|uniref:mycothiol synthase n=1 Tax=Pseudonocardia pini TaxID=2758030 RepID=UPI0028AC54C1|nr:mycothiol synthase [Pseudonocardia pini]